MATSRFLPSLAALTLALTTARLHAADPDTRAREHYDRAVELYTQGDYAAALSQLRQAAELRPHYRLQRALAQVHAAMNDYAAAYTANRLYLEQGGDKITPERRQEVSAEMAKLERLVALVTLAVDVPGALIRIDDSNVGQAPLSTPIALNVGPHQVIVSHPAYPDQSRAITAAAGTSERLEFSLAGRQPAAARDTSAGGELAAPHETATARSDAEDGAMMANAPGAEPAPPDYVWLGWVATGALAAGATATGLWALSKNSSLDDDRQRAASQGNMDRELLDSRASSLRVLATVTDVLWVAAAAAGGVTLWLTLDTAEPARRGALDPALSAGIGPGGVSLRTTF
jgi:hypothetical protein